MLNVLHSKRLIYPARKLVIGILLSIGITISGLIVPSILSIPVFAQNSQADIPFSWESINVDIDVQENGDMLIREEQTYVFKSDYSNQRYRYIPLDKVDQITDVIIQEDGQTIPGDMGIENNQLWIRWQHELTPPSKHTVVIQYRVVGGLQQEGQNTQIYWKALFPNRSVPIQSGSVTVKLPNILDGTVSNYASYGVTANSETFNGITFKFITKKELRPGQKLGVKIVFPSQALDVPLPLWQMNQLRDQSTAIKPTPKLLSFLCFLFVSLVVLASMGGHRDIDIRRSSYRHGDGYGSGSS